MAHGVKQIKAIIHRTTVHLDAHAVDMRYRHNEIYII